MSVQQHLLVEVTVSVKRGYSSCAVSLPHIYISSFGVELSSSHTFYLCLYSLVPYSNKINRVVMHHIWRCPLIYYLLPSVQMGLEVHLTVQYIHCSFPHMSIVNHRWFTMDILHGHLGGITKAKDGWVLFRRAEEQGQVLGGL